MSPQWGAASEVIDHPIAILVCAGGIHHARGGHSRAAHLHSRCRRRADHHAHPQHRPGTCPAAGAPTISAARAANGRAHRRGTGRCRHWQRRWFRARTDRRLCQARSCARVTVDGSPGQDLAHDAYDGGGHCQPSRGRDGQPRPEDAPHDRRRRLKRTFDGRGQQPSSSRSHEIATRSQ